MQTIHAHGHIHDGLQIRTAPAGGIVAALVVACAGFLAAFAFCIDTSCVKCMGAEGYRSVLPPDRASTQLAQPVTWEGAAPTLKPKHLGLRDRRHLTIISSLRTFAGGNASQS
jgi:hypothetical protein